MSNFDNLGMGDEGIQKSNERKSLEQRQAEWDKEHTGINAEFNMDQYKYGRPKRPSEKTDQFYEDAIKSTNSFESIIQKLNRGNQLDQSSKSVRTLTPYKWTFPSIQKNGQYYNLDMSRVLYPGSTYYHVYTQSKEDVQYLSQAEIIYSRL